MRVQFLGSDPACMAENAARVATLGALGVDLNFGCPTKLVNRHGGGAALLKDPELMRTIVRAVRQAVPAAIPVTAKMRLGYDSTDRALECAEALADGGAAEIVVHARTRTDGYRPPAYWEWIARIREHVRVPVIANGEIWTVEDARRCLAVSGCDDLMLGRGAVANPALALMIRGDRDAGFSWSEMWPMLRQFWAAIELHMPARFRHGRLKQWLLHLARHYPEAQEQFDRIRRVVRPEDIGRAPVCGRYWLHLLGRGPGTPRVRNRNAESTRRNPAGRDGQLPRQPASQHLFLGRRLLRRRLQSSTSSSTVPCPASRLRVGRV